MVYEKRSIGGDERFRMKLIADDAESLVPHSHRDTLSVIRDDFKAARNLVKDKGMISCDNKAAAFEHDGVGFTVHTDRCPGRFSAEVLVYYLHTEADAQDRDTGLKNRSVVGVLRRFPWTGRDYRKFIFVRINAVYRRIRHDNRMALSA